MPNNSYEIILSSGRIYSRTESTRNSIHTMAYTIHTQDPTPCTSPEFVSAELTDPSKIHTYDKSVTGFSVECTICGLCCPLRGHIFCRE